MHPPVQFVETVVALSSTQIASLAATEALEEFTLPSDGVNAVSVVGSIALLNTFTALCPFGFLRSITLIPVPEGTVSHATATCVMTSGCVVAIPTIALLTVEPAVNAGKGMVMQVYSALSLTSLSQDDVTTL